MTIKIDIHHSEFVRFITYIADLFSYAVGIENVRKQIDEATMEKTVKEEVKNVPKEIIITIPKIENYIAPQGNTNRVTPRLVVGEKDSSVQRRDLPNVFKKNERTRKKIDSLRQVIKNHLKNN